MKKTLTVSEFAALGGKARWKGKNKKERSIAMKKVRAAALKLSTTSKHDNSIDEQARRV